MFFCWQVIFEYKLLRGHNTIEQEQRNIQELFRTIEKFMEKKPQASKSH